MPASLTVSIRETARFEALQALQCTNPSDKISAVQRLNARVSDHQFSFDCSDLNLTDPGSLPGRPDRPALLSHLDVPQISIFTARGLAGLAHSVCHIEFNAINLALDAVWRFPGMPTDYYTQWIRVACEEAHHFSLLRAQLHSMGYDYGDFPSHTGLWDMVERTKGDVVARMALVPRTLEARGLDATPPMQAKLRKVGTPDALKLVTILDVILRDEVGHVAIGNHWYRWLCDRERLDPISHFRKLCEQYSAPRVRAPINEEARRLAGFQDAEMAELLLNQ